MPKLIEKPATRARVKPITFVGTSLEDLRDFPQGARREAGFQLGKAQQGDEPDDWKPMPGVGSGACEIRIRDDAGIFRVLYVAKFAESVYALHVFQKKTQKTSQKDLDLARRRYAEVVSKRKHL